MNNMQYSDFLAMAREIHAQPRRSAKDDFIALLNAKISRFPYSIKFWA